MSAGTLFLMQTPLDQELGVLSPLEVAFLQDFTGTVLVEEVKSIRRLLLRSKVDRSFLDRFQLYNEHNQHLLNQEILRTIASQGAVLIVEAGLPGLYDPGRELIKLAHRRLLKVSVVGNHSSSVSLSLCLSGLVKNEVVIRGFLPQKQMDRDALLREAAKEPRPQLMLETPYRFAGLVENLLTLAPKRELVLCHQLQTQNEAILCYFDAAKQESFLQQVKSLPKGPTVLVWGEGPT